MCVIYPGLSARCVSTLRDRRPEYQAASDRNFCKMGGGMSGRPPIPVREPPHPTVAWVTRLVEPYPIHVQVPTMTEEARHGAECRTVPRAAALASGCPAREIRPACHLIRGKCVRVAATPLTYKNLRQRRADLEREQTRANPSTTQAAGHAPPTAAPTPRTLTDVSTWLR
jgi:hypothetical protein